MARARIHNHRCLDVGARHRRQHGALSIFSSLILRSLPVRDPGSLALLTNGSWSYPIWKEIQARETLFDGTLAWSVQRFDLSPRGQSDPVDGAAIAIRGNEVDSVVAHERNGNIAAHLKRRLAVFFACK